MKRVKKWLRSGDDLYELSKSRSVYEGYIINEIFCEEGNEFIDFTSKEGFLRLGEAIGDVNNDEFKRLQIRKTIADGSAYELIMKKKEELLSFKSKLKFIFSHSALREGWDNPNVFQICTLNETGSLMKKRQEIGRGLRIAVNQDGERVYGFDVNTLTVMANESYEDFVSQLQKEIEEDEGIKFGVVDDHLFANIPIEGADHKTTMLGTDASEEIWQHLLDEKYIDKNGKVQDHLQSRI